jgi:formate dehydrogenase major subunit
MVTTTETQLVTLTIDGMDVTVPAGTYILQAAEAAGVEVPNLCFQPLLRPWGSCRLCTVEILGQRGGLIESCATPVRDGMEVLTESQRVVEARQFILQMYLIDHALDCPTCDKSGECYLQDNTYLHNVEVNPYRRPKLAQPYVHHSDFIDYKWDRCIICARCTRVCHEMTGVTAIEVSNRGLEAEITPAYGQDLADTTCSNCGMCIAVCPVGALTDRHFGHHPWEMDSVETVCGMCDVGCTINAEYNRGIVRRTTHLWDRGVNLGYTCELGRWGHEHVQDPTRLWNAKVRTAAAIADVSLEEAWTAAANGLAAHRGDSFALLTTPDNPNEDNFVAQLFSRAVMKSNNVDRLMPSSQVEIDSGMQRSFGLIANPAGMQEMMTDSEAVIYAGPDPGKVAPIASYWLYWAHRYRETSIIVVSPDASPLAERSDHWLQTKPGTEGDVLKALAVLAHGLSLTPDGIDTTWFLNADIDDIVDRSGVNREELEDCARIFAQAASHSGAAAIWYALDDREDAAASKALVTSAHNLAVGFETVGKPGGGILALRNAANMQGSIDVGCHPALLPGQSDVSDGDALSRASQAWSQIIESSAASPNGTTPMDDLSSIPGVGIAGLAAAIRSGDINALYISAQSHHRGSVKDDYFSAGERGYFEDGPSQIWSRRFDVELLDALEELDFLVVEDCFPSELTALADVVLPTAMNLEVDGTFTNLDRTVQRTRFVVSAPGDSQATRTHLAEIASRLGYNIRTENPSDLFDSIAQEVDDYAAISYPRLERSGIQWPATRFGSPGAVRLEPGQRLNSDHVRIVTD